MEVEQQELFGPVNVEGYGIIMVPGNNEYDRVAYAMGLTVRGGIFIPNKPCESVMTLDMIEEGAPFIAIGTMKSYGCYTIEDLLMIPDYQRELVANLPELITFARQYGSSELEQKLLKIELGPNYFDTLRSIILSKTATEIKLIMDAFNILKVIFVDCKIKPKANDLIKAKQAIDVIDSIIYGLRGVKKVGIYYVPTELTYSELVRDMIVGTICLKNFADITQELMNAINSIFTSKGLAGTDVILTPQRREEITKIGPEIMLQPGGKTMFATQQQGPWATPIYTTQVIPKAYRTVYEICGGIIDHDSLQILARELGVQVPLGYTDSQLCSYLKNYIERTVSK